MNVYLVRVKSWVGSTPTYDYQIVEHDSAEQARDALQSIANRKGLRVEFTVLGKVVLE